MTIRKTSSKLLAALLLAALLLLALPPAARAAATLNLDLVDPDDVAESVIRLDPDLGTTPLPDGSYLIVYYGTGPLTISGQGDYTVQVAAAIDTVILEDGAVFGDGSDDALSLYNENTTLTGEGSGIILNGGIYAAENLTVAGSIDEINSLFVGIIANGNINITGSIGNIYAVDSGILSSSGNITVSSTVYSSYLKWSCSNTEIRSPGDKMTSPTVESSSPDRIFRNVDLPAPFAPMMP